MLAVADRQFESGEFVSDEKFHTFPDSCGMTLGVITAK